MMEDCSSKSKKKTHKFELMTKISSTKNVSGIGCVILLGGALITAAAMGSAFLNSRKHRKSTNKVTKNEKTEDQSSNKGLHFLLPEQHQPSSSNGTDKLCDNDSTTSLCSTPCLIQDEKPKLDDKRDILNAIVSDHPKEEGNSPSLERLVEELELSETKISLLPDPDQELDEVSRVIIEEIQGNEKIEILSRVDQAQDAMFIYPALQMDDKGESNELQHTGVIEMDNLEEGIIQEQEKQPMDDQETSTSNECEPLNSAFELMKAADEDKDKDRLKCVYFEEQCADAGTQTHQFAKKCHVPMQFNDEEEGVKLNDEANYEEATSENSPCRTCSIDVQNLDASAIRNASLDDEPSAEACEDEDKSHMQIMCFEEQCVDEETKIDQIANKCDVQMQFSEGQVFINDNDQANSCYDEATSESSHRGTYSMDTQTLAASEIRNALVDDQHSAEVIQVIKETCVMDPAATGEQRLDTEQLVEKQSFEPDCQGHVLNENEVDASVFVNEEAGEEYDDYDDNTEKEDAAQEVKDDILEGARNSSEQSNSDKIWPANSNQEPLLEHKQENVKEEEEGTKIEKDELSSAENCNLKSTQTNVAITSCQQSNDGKDGSAVNVIGSYRTKLVYLDDIAAITRRRRVLLGAILVLIWYFVLKGVLPV